MYYKYASIMIAMREKDQVFRFTLDSKRDEKINEEMKNFLLDDSVSMFCIGTLWNETARFETIKPTVWKVKQKTILYTTDPTVAILFKLKFAPIIRKVQTSTKGTTRYVRDMEWTTMS